jgi:peptidoglycan/LPS O-acetylase OafA/YrhL
VTATGDDVPDAHGSGQIDALDSSTTDERLQASGDEAGTAPGDRKFRPDIEGLRAWAILLVVLFHAGVPGITGGFVGVDVFFVLSGFVITGLLLRERISTGKNKFGGFYGRRSRRILPAASVVIILTIFASYHWLGFLTGNAVAHDARAASLFFANFQFIHQGTNYLASQTPPSPLQNFWSLAVEEQFYLVFPSLFIAAAVLLKKRTLEAKLGTVLVVIICASLFWSIHQTSVNSTVAFFSPFTRAWELALGALVAVFSTRISRIPKLTAVVMGWLGLVGILVAAFAFSTTTPYPGSAALLPVLSTVMVVAAGRVNPVGGAETLLRIPPFQWMGRISYSLYLWHWPILVIASQYAGHPLSVSDNLLWLLLALALSIASYKLLENPIRHWRVLVKSASLSMLAGLALIVLSVGIATIEIAQHS